MKSENKKLILLIFIFALATFGYTVYDKLFVPDRVELARTFYQAGELTSLGRVFQQFPWLECLGNTALQWAIFLLLLLSAHFLRPHLEKISRWITGMPRFYFLSAVFLIAFLAAWGIFYFKYAFFPKSGDENAILFQVKILRQGTLTVPSHPLREFFDSDYIINNGKMYAEYPIGTSLFLLLGDFWGMPWIVNPLLGALGLVFLCLCGEHLYDNLSARFGVILALCSPFYYSMAATYLSHAPQFFLLSVFIYFMLLTLQEKPRPYYPLISGLALGMAVNTRPMTAVTFSCPLLLWALYLLIKDWRGFYRRALMFCLGLIPLILMLFLINKIQNGSSLRFGHEIYNGTRPTLGFSELYSLRQAVSALFFRMRLILYNLTFHPVRAGIILLFLALSFVKYKPQNSLLWSFFVFTCLGYLSVASSIWQTRYYYAAVLYLFLLIPVGIINLGEWLKRHFNFACAAGLLTLFTLMVSASALYEAVTSDFKPASWLRVYQRPYLVAQEHNLSNALVFLRSTKLYYPAWYTRNSPDLNDSVLWVQDLGEMNKELMEYYPDRKVYLYDFNGGDKAKDYNYGSGELQEIK